jgi:hypothetical protein
MKVITVNSLWFSRFIRTLRFTTLIAGHILFSICALAVGTLFPIWLTVLYYEGWNYYLWWYRSVFKANWSHIFKGFFYKTKL